MSLITVNVETNNASLWKSNGLRPRTDLTEARLPDVVFPTLKFCWRGVLAEGQPGSTPRPRRKLYPQNQTLLFVS